MIQSVSFQNFRGFKRLDLPDLAPITLLSGKNNAGKSTALEGLFLFLDHTESDCFAKINSFRNLPMSANFDVLWRPLFFRGNYEDDILLFVEMDDKKFTLSYSRDDTYTPLPRDFSNIPPEMKAGIFSSAQNGCTLRFRCSEETTHQEEIGHFIVTPMPPSGFVVNIKANFPENQKFPMPLAQFINSTIYDHVLMTDLFGKIELSGLKGNVLVPLRKMDPDLQDILAVPINGQVPLYGRTAAGLLPMRLAGDGMNRLLFMMMSIVGNPKSVILIDEIETGFHYSMYPILWETISRAAQESSCQIIATTHSYECIEGAVTGVERANLKDDFLYYRLEQVDKNRCAYSYSWDLLRFALEKTMEVR